MEINEMTRNDFLKLPKIEREVAIDSLVFIPTRIRDMSGYNLFNIVACRKNKAIGKIGLYDTHSIIMESKWNRVGIDCLRKSSLMRIFLPDEYIIDTWLHTTRMKENKQ